MIKQSGSVLYLTKPLCWNFSYGTKERLLEDEHKDIAANSMIILNDVGLELSEMEEVTLTDVTGFGLMAIYLKSVKEAMYLPLLIIAKCLFSKRFMTISIKNASLEVH
jgi:selenophosphate synthase